MEVGYRMQSVPLIIKLVIAIFKLFIRVLILLHINLFGSFTIYVT